MCPFFAGNFKISIISIYGVMTEGGYMKVILYLNFAISVIFTLCYFYQIVYVFVGLFGKSLRFTAKKNHRFAVMISARNESGVIAHLIDSLHKQNYPKELLDIFVVADNCTDNTAEVAKEAGAIVYERFNQEQVGKGFALNWLLNKIWTEHADKQYEGYFVFDADNVVLPSFVSSMNAVFDQGYRLVTSYRNSKNFGDNWISAGYSIWFLREAKFLNNARMQLGTSCAVSGTGFLVSDEIFRRNGGWVHYLLTEDIEFTTDSIIKGEKVGYCADAVLFDEQPDNFKTSYTQRLRWSKGFYQVFYHYGAKLLKGALKGNFSCFDMLMTISPAMLLTLFSAVLNAIAIPVCLFIDAQDTLRLLVALVNTLLSFYALFFALGGITTITEWKQIHCRGYKKILYIFTFPLFMFTYIPISIIALFKKVKWDPIKHKVSSNIDDICAK